MVKTYFNNISGKIENDINFFTGGINTYIDKAFINKNQLSYAMNVGMYQPPKMSTRPSRVTLASFMKDTFEYADSDIYDIFTYSENEFYAICISNEGDTSLCEFKKIDDYFEKKTIAILPTYDHYYMCYCRQAEYEYLYIMNENFKSRIQINTDEEDTYQEYDDNIYGIPAFHKGRLFIANPETNVVSFSALYDFDNFALVDNNNFIIFNGNVDELTALPEEEIDFDAIYLVSKNETKYWQYQPYHNGIWRRLFNLVDKEDVVIDYSVIAGDFMVTNAHGKIVSMKSFDSKLIIFCEHSIHALYGESPSTSTNAFTLLDLDNGIGAISEKSTAIGGGRLYWLGNDLNIYEYTGSYINIISRPNEDGEGGIEGVTKFDMFMSAEKLKDFQFACTGSKLYVNVSNNPSQKQKNNLLFVYDMFNKVWWCEDGEFTAIAEYQATIGTVLLARKNGDILISKAQSTGDSDFIYNASSNSIITKPIEYSFETKVYGIDGVSMRKTLSEVSFQARANAEVYVGEYWTSINQWEKFSTQGYKRIGSLQYKEQPKTLETFNQDKYESQTLNVPIMFVQRVNGFSVLVTGTGKAEFFLMERKWRAV